MRGGEVGFGPPPHFGRAPFENCPSPPHTKIFWGLFLMFFFSVLTDFEQFLTVSATAPEFFFPKNNDVPVHLLDSSEYELSMHW